MMTVERAAALPFPFFLAALESAGYVRVDVVKAVGEFSIRGGIVDVFSPDAGRPVRMEFCYDLVEYIREFDPLTRRPVGASLASVTLSDARWLTAAEVAEQLSLRERQVWELIAEGKLTVWGHEVGSFTRISVDSIEQLLAALRRAGITATRAQT